MRVNAERHEPRSPMGTSLAIRLAGYRRAMRAVYAIAPDPDNPLDAVRVGDRPEPEERPGWVRVGVRAASLNRHDLWTLRGVGIKPEQFPMILGCDGAGVLEDGTPVVIYPIIGDRDFAGDETLDPRRTLLTEKEQGTFADLVGVPARNAVPMPSSMTFEQAATLGTSYLTAYRMIFTRSGLAPGSTMLVQGASGGVSTALIQLGVAGGMRVWVTARSDDGRERAERLGAAAVFSSGARLPERVDGVFESVGKATWPHSMRAVRPGGVVVCCGATTGPDPSADLQRLFFLQISVVGSTMGTREEFLRLLSFCDTAGIVPVVDRSYSLEAARQALAELDTGSPGKVVITV
jgi:NADPH:quinone reductase-like Zn-dependent oxidoreductase